MGLFSFHSLTIQFSIGDVKTDVGVAKQDVGVANPKDVDDIYGGSTDEESDFEGNDYAHHEVLL